MRPGIALLRARTLLSVSAAAAEGYGMSRVRAARTAMRLRRRNGFDLEGALLEGLLDPEMDERVRDAHIGRTMRRAAQDRLNPVSLEPFTEQKLVFYDYFRASGMPVPEVYGTVGPLGGWSRLTGRRFSGRDQFAAFIAGLPADIVIKPSFGNRGDGVRVFARDGEGGLTRLDGSPVDIAALHDRICAGGEGEGGLQIVQQRIRNHPAIERIAASTVLQTLRISSIVRPDGSVLVFGGVLKLAVGTADTDNFHDGETGNGYCAVSLDEGELGPLTLRAPGGVGLRQTPVVEATGTRVAGLRIPFVQDACHLVRRAALLLQPMRTLGWDVALTADGPVILEANNWWAPFAPLSSEAWALMLGDDGPGSARRGRPGRPVGSPRAGTEGWRAVETPSRD